MTQRIQAIHTSAETPVENLFIQSLGEFAEIHKELSKLPDDKNDPLQPAEALLRGLGVDVDNDYSMFVMGAMGNMGTDVAMHAAGLPTGGAFSTGLDVASGVLMGLVEYNEAGKKGKNDKKAGATSMFRTSPFKRAEPKAPQDNKPSTSMLKRAAERKKHLQVKNTQNKRAQLKKRMKIVMDNIGELVTFRSCGVTHAHRVTVPNGETGETESYLVAAKEKPHQALKANGKSYEKPIDVSMVQRPMMAPRLGMCG